jgi:hypothetical protein
MKELVRLEPKPWIISSRNFFFRKFNFESNRNPKLFSLINRPPMVFQGLERNSPHLHAINNLQYRIRRPRSFNSSPSHPSGLCFFFFRSNLAQAISPRSDVSFFFSHQLFWLIETPAVKFFLPSFLPFTYTPVELSNSCFKSFPKILSPHLTIPIHSFQGLERSGPHLHTIPWCLDVYTDSSFDSSPSTNRGTRSDIVEASV